MKKTRVLITGANGQLGQALQSIAPINYQLYAADRAEFDITDRSQIESVVSCFKPDCIVNAAAYTRVDDAEKDVYSAKTVNEDAVRWLAEKCAALRCRLVHISTDFVFDGSSNAPAGPETPTAPINVYGTTKRAGEVAALEATNGQALIVRTAWLFGPTGKNFLTTVARLLRERTELAVVDDQHGTPTLAKDLAQAIWILTGSGGVSGIHHFTNAGDTTWYGFACRIRECMAASGHSNLATITATKTSQAPRPALRPEYSILDCAYTYAITGKPRSWFDAASEALASGAWLAQS